MAALLVIPIAKGEILEDFGTDAELVAGEHVQLTPGRTISTASGQSDGDDPFNCGGAFGWRSLYTTEEKGVS
jgi:hypothetical protein